MPYHAELRWLLDRPVEPGDDNVGRIKCWKQITN
jgi:hypothetical protein